MITERSIEEVKETVDIKKVAELICKLELKKSGANYFAISPYNTGEKTGSFCISPSRQRFKCFSTGNSGDAIRMVMDHEKCDFPEAIRFLADYFNITIEETAAREEDRELKEKKASYYDLTRGASSHWMKALYDLPGDHWANQELLVNRRLMLDTIVDFNLGYAPDQWKFLSERMVKSGFYQQGAEIGLISSNEERWFDTFRDRIMFPIHTHRGQIAGFGGRKPNDGDKKSPKYINSKASPIYRKEELLYGLYQAQDFIRKQDQAILVEGYYDVLMMHQAGLCNTVATCGTAITESHAKRLHRLCKYVLLILDGDEAGTRATLKAIDILVQEGLRVDVCPLPEGQDPDSFVRSMTPESLYSKSDTFNYLPIIENHDTKETKGVPHSLDADKRAKGKAKASA